ncbi:uncharacterized protein A4U43_C04F23030 [Asparagus officinalis]|uniref:Uncharacterized protein n=1 Tax=Asparagus officinalis TaxID=4686 RepID=A0A5P1F8D6_ASPOF|nr:uncharacterized protein A4U43_C04F23030 [Asparagus officinalis]
MSSSSQSIASNSMRKSWAEEVESAVPLLYQHRNLIPTSNLDRSLSSSRNLETILTPANNLDRSMNSAWNLEANSVLDDIPINDSVKNTKSAKDPLHENILNSACKLGNDSVPLEESDSAKASINPDVPKDQADILAPVALSMCSKGTGSNSEHIQERPTNMGSC